MMLLRRKSLRALLLGVIVFGSQVATCAQSEKPVDRILIEKSAHLMTLYRGNQAIRKYKVALGTQPVGRKERQGDHKTPEGLYTVDRKNPQSIFHMALHLSYPNAEDRKRAKKLGSILAGMWRFMVWRRNMRISERFTAKPTGLTAA